MQVQGGLEENKSRDLSSDHSTSFDNDIFTSLPIAMVKVYGFITNHREIKNIMYRTSYWLKQH